MRWVWVNGAGAFQAPSFVHHAPESSSGRPHSEDLALCAAAIVCAIGTTTGAISSLCRRRLRLRDGRYRCACSGVHGGTETMFGARVGTVPQRHHHSAVSRRPDGVRGRSGQWRRQGSRLEHEPAPCRGDHSRRFPLRREASWTENRDGLQGARQQEQSVMVTRARIDVCF